jgi:nucleotide-binding universal stress UspA family protein
MNPIKRILICLDNSETDEFILRYSQNILKKANVDAIYFLHVAKSLDIPEDVAAKYPDLLAPLDEAVKQNFTFRINNYFEKDSYQIDILEGGITKEILKHAKRKKIDLLIMGHKNGKGTSDVIQRKIAKISNTSLLLIPEIEIVLHPIVVPIDFSKNSAGAMEQAITIAKLNQVEILAHHVYYVPSGYHKTGKSYEEFAKIMEQNAKEEFKVFIEEFDTEGVKISEHYSLDDNNNPADKISEFAKSKNTGLIIIGSRGRTAMASMVLGSVAEKVISLNKETPLLIIKDKDENMDLLDAIFNL